MEHNLSITSFMDHALYYLLYLKSHSQTQLPRIIPVIL